MPTPVVTELDAFVTTRLLTTDTIDGIVVMGVTHEAFLSAWPPLAQAIAANASALRARRAVEQAATPWHEHGRPRQRLWSGGQLAAAVTDTGARTRTSSAPPSAHGLARWSPRARRVLVTDRVDLSATAREFLHTSIRRDRSRRRRALTVLSTLSVLALVAAGIALGQRHTAQQQLRLATARQLIAQANGLTESDPLTALKLSLAAHHIDPNGETHSTLVHNLTTPTAFYSNTLTGHTSSVVSVAFSPDGRTLATASYDRTVRLWDLTDRAHPSPLGAPLTGHTSGVGSVAFAPDGRTLATASDDQTVRLWDLTDRAHPSPLGAPLTGHTSGVGSVAFAPDGRTLATASGDRTVRLWDLTGLDDFLSHAVERACSITHGGLDPDEWARYIPGLPYQNTCPH